MKLTTFRYEGINRLGSIVGNQVVDLNNAYEALLRKQGKLRAQQIAEAYVPADMLGFLQGGEESMAKAKEAEAFALQEGTAASGKKLVYGKPAVRIDAPLLNPGKIICVGHNYREHILEMKREIPTIPVVFAKYNNTIIANGDPIPKPIVSDFLDYEAEMAFVIGKGGRHIAESEALSHVAGYSVANDVSVRDYQRVTMEWLKGKTFDDSLPMGPFLLTADEVPDPHALEIHLQVNGEERQRSNTRNLVFTVPFLVAFLSKIMTLEPGDIVLTGTPGGVGVARDPEVYLREGDVVRVEIEGIGVIENKVVNEAKK